MVQIFDIESQKSVQVHIFVVALDYDAAQQDKSTSQDDTIYNLFLP